MKKAITNTKTITMGLISLFIMGSAQAALSNQVAPTPIELKAISDANKQPLFELKMNNTEAGEFLVKVKDGNGDILYSETLKGKNISRKYMIEVNEEASYDPFNVRFEISSVKTHETFIYKVSRNSRLVQDLVVAKL